MVQLIRGAPPEGFSSGYGSGYGDGDGEKTYRLAVLDSYAALLPQSGKDRFAELREAGATLAYWNSDAQGRPCNGGSGDPVKPGDVHEVEGPLNLCSSSALHATYFPRKWKGERVWIVALIGEVKDDGDKLGALKREIIGECV